MCGPGTSRPIYNVELTVLSVHHAQRTSTSAQNPKLSQDTDHEIIDKQTTDNNRAKKAEYHRI